MISSSLEGRLFAWLATGDWQLCAVVRSTRGQILLAEKCAQFRYCVRFG